jgi:hypothetical protein
MEQQMEVWKLFRTQQEKYVYYLLSLAVAAIAFAVAQTKDDELVWTHFILLIPVILWLVSIHNGLKWIKWNLSTLYANFDLLRVRSGHFKEQLPTIFHEQAAAEGINQAIDSNSNVIRKSYSIQNNTFYWGIAFFIFWHLMEMILRSI